MNIQIEKIIRAAHAGGAALSAYFGEVLETESKSNSSDFRTKADVESETEILNILEREFPEANILSEERGITDKRSAYQFVVDPLDGTNNFVLGIPYIAVNIALFKGDTIIASVVYNPILNQTCVAEAGKGAHLNGNLLHVSAETNITNATISYMQDYIDSKEKEASIFRELLMLNVKRPTMLWCPGNDYMLFASGRIEGIINNGNSPYDYAAGLLFAREAGAIITDLEGSPLENDRNNRFVVSCTKEIHGALLNASRCLR